MNNLDHDVRAGARDVRAGRLAACIAALIAVAVWTVAAAPGARADDARQAGGPSGGGAIAVTYAHDDTPLAGVPMRLHRVAVRDALTDGYVPVPGFDGYALDWDSARDGDGALRRLALTLHAYVRRDDPAATASVRTDADGGARFAGLADGLYLLSADRYRDAALDCASSAVLAEVLDGDVEVALAPKTDCEAPGDAPGSVAVRKVWRGDDDATRPSSVQVQLLRDGEVWGTATLDGTNGWYHRWASLEAGHDWMVIERDVPAGYTVSVDRDGDGTDIVNTRTADGSDLAHTGADAARIAVAVVMLSGAGLLIVAVRRVRSHGRMVSGDGRCEIQ